MDHTDSIDVDLDEQTELLFKVKIEGAKQEKATVRLVCEGSDHALLFSGKSLGHDDLVQFIIPSLASKTNEGLHSAKIEVMIENRYFVPVSFSLNVKKTIKVVAESVTEAKKFFQPNVVVKAEPVTPTLKERYVQKSKLVEVQKPVEDLNEESILTLASKFLQKSKTKR